ncbi:hypothetical protein CAL7716_020300 [Calothrix sp. PCC 7716]|nr:hypothetical protein CAL7716_020300 [Calothrix sp. PCC 7716]
MPVHSSHFLYHRDTEYTEKESKKINRKGRKGRKEKNQGESKYPKARRTYNCHDSVVGGKINP